MSCFSFTVTGVVILDSQMAPSGGTSSDYSPMYDIYGDEEIESDFTLLWGREQRTWVLVGVDGQILREKENQSRNMISQECGENTFNSEVEKSYEINGSWSVTLISLNYDKLCLETQATYPILKEDVDSFLRIKKNKLVLVPQVMDWFISLDVNYLSRDISTSTSQPHVLKEVLDQSYLSDTYPIDANINLVKVLLPIGLVSLMKLNASLPTTNLNKEPICLNIGSLNICYVWRQIKVRDTYLSWIKNSQVHVPFDPGGIGPTSSRKNHRPKLVEHALIASHKERGQDVPFDPGGLCKTRGRVLLKWGENDGGTVR